MELSRIGSIFTVIFLSIICGCASNPSISSLKPEQRARLNTIQVYKLGVDKPYKIIGTVKGLSCHRNAYQKQLLTEEEAIEGVKLEAAILGADAVINVACQVNSGTDWVNNCWSSIVCVGDAIKYE
ncbi:Rcs stress response system protein RcsF [uncultured Desulfosarcina sp.]|uniref:Rcs stress response system protein RcsF n=1 Tax=uncultured Desulfosarcina sp. TaxID=218289 RepID=UPI0029C63A5A|nr:Rcs stress response system protein RcsF [uncultured Desulfosarcina sp.]